MHDKTTDQSCNVETFEIPEENYPVVDILMSGEGKDLVRQLLPEELETMAEKGVDNVLHEGHHIFRSVLVQLC